MSKTTRRGLFVVIEGLDGSGKTTLLRRLADAYAGAGLRVTCVREPGGTPVSEQVRRILLDHRNTMGARTELFLYLAARAQLVDEVIRPALARGDLVLADRFHLSTLAYQIGGRGLPARTVAGADLLARDRVSPDLTVFLEVTEKDAAARRHSAPKDRIEREPKSFFRAVRREYRLLTHRRRGMLTIDSGLGIDRVFDTARRAIDRRLNRRGKV